MTDSTNSERELAKWLSMMWTKYEDNGETINNAWLLIARELRGRQWQEMHCQLGLLREKIEDLYHQVGKVEVWSKGNDVVCDLCEEKVGEIISEMQVELESHFLSLKREAEAPVATEGEGKLLEKNKGVRSQECSASVATNIDYTEKGMTSNTYRVRK